MKKLLSTLVEMLSVSLCITAIVIPQALQKYTKTIVNGEEKWTLNKQYLSAFDAEKPRPQEIDPQNLFHQKQNSSPDNLFDDRWTLQQPYPTDAWLLAVEADNDFIISTGLSGLSSTPYSELIISTNRGETWTLQRFGTDSLISSIDKYENLIWLGGLVSTPNNGFILKSTDLGKNWEEKLSVDSFGVLYVNFFDENKGVVVSVKENSDSTSLKIFHTTDGGDSWTPNFYTYQGGTQGLKSFHFSNPNDGWQCIGDLPFPSDMGRIMNTTDGGLTWNLQMIDSLDNLDLIKFYDSNYGWAIGHKYDGTKHKLLLYSTTNGGNYWVEQKLFDVEQYIFLPYDMFIQDSLNGWLAVFDNPDLTIYKSNDGFTSLNTLSVINEANFLMGEIEFISSTEGWITSGLGMILYTSDGGDSWNSKHKSVTTEYLYSLDFVDENRGWAASIGSESVIIETENGGVDWDKIYSDSTIRYVDMDFVSEQTGFVVTDNYLANIFAINKT